ncbi:MAG: cupin [Bacillota bacterium]|nr:cupin [Bacillota bacterium]
MQFLKSPGVPGKSKLVDDGKAVVVCANLKAGAKIPAHSSPKSVLVTIVKGRVFFGDGKDGGEEIFPGKAVYMNPGDLHNLEAIEDSELFIIHF